LSVFSRLTPELQEAIVNRLHWTSLRPVQDLAGEALLAGKNAVILAPTAGGKTEAAMFPTLSQLVDSRPQAVGAIYIAPIKALLNNQADRLGTYTEMVGLRRFVWHGDIPDTQKANFLKDPADVLMTTPESIEVILVTRPDVAQTLFSDLRHVIIDEIHALAGTDRGAHLMSVIERLAAISRHDIQRIGLSATVGNPTQILEWLQGGSRRDRCIVDPPKQPRGRQINVVYRPSLEALAQDAAAAARGKKSLFFCQSRATAEAVADLMERRGTTVFVHHSSVSRAERTEAEARFQHGSDACIVCTSTLELGIDVGDLDRVMQAEAPGTVSSFLQRMGRTGRREGQTPNTTFFCEGPASVLLAIALVELSKDGWVESVDTPDRCWPVLVHQLMTMSLAKNGITAEQAWAHLSTVPDFAGIHRAEFDRLISWMLSDGGLRLASGLLVIGPRAERRFGRMNFKEMYAVFTSPQTYAVIENGPARRELGNLNQGFVDRLVDGVSCFLLGGGRWGVIQVDHDRRTVVVEPAPAGRQPTWGGFLPQFLGLEVCQKIRDIVASDAAIPYIDAPATRLLEGERDAMRGMTLGRRGGVRVSGGEYQWWTYAGGRINSTIRYALQALHPEWTIVPDNFCIAIKGDTLNNDTFTQALAELATPELWQDDTVWSTVRAGLPNYRLSKFQPFVPPWVEQEIVATYLLDIAATWRWLSREQVPLVIATTDTNSLPSPQRPRIPAPPPLALPDPADASAASGDGATSLPIARRDSRRPIRWVTTQEELRTAVDALLQERVIGLDVETTLGTRTLCLAQIAATECTYLIDALALDTLQALDLLLVSPAVTKLIHNAQFESQVLGQHGLSIEPVVDTMHLSRNARGHGTSGGHSLAAVCQRELGVAVCKQQQTSDWTRRPLDESQVAYAALDAELLLQLFARLS